MKRILVIEDEPQMRLGLRDNLELEGYDVETAADGDEGLQKAASLHAGPGHSRRDAAEEERLRRVPRPAGAVDRDADRDADGALGRDRQGARPRAGRGRLRHQAVLDHRAAGAGARGAAADRRAASRPPT